MATQTSEITAITNDYFLLDGGKAWDNYFYDSYAVNLFMKQKKGLFKMVPGGDFFQVPVEYNNLFATHYEPGTSSMTRVSSATYGGSWVNQIIMNAKYTAVHYVGAAKVYRIDTLKNRGEYAIVDHVTSRIANAQKSLAKKLSHDFHSSTNSTAQNYKIWSTLEGALAVDPTRAAPDANYGNIDVDAYSWWVGTTTAKNSAINTNMIREMRADGKMRDGKGGKPDLIMMTETLFNSLKDILMTQQRYTENKDVTKLGFDALDFEGATVVCDDYVPSGYMIALCTDTYGYQCYEDGYFEKTDWQVLTDTASDMFMDLYVDGQIVSSCRKNIVAYSGVAA